MHSKGVTKPEDPGVYDWRNYLDYFTIYKARDCIELLDKYDVVGANFVDIPESGKYHFSGNYWWTRGSYYLTLPREIGIAYTDPEFYVCGSSPKVYCINLLRTISPLIVPSYLRFYPYRNYIDDLRPSSTEGEFIVGAKN